MSLTSKLRKAASLTLSDWLVLGEAFWSLTATHARLMLFPSRLEFLQKAPGSLQSGRPAQIPRLVELFDIAARNHPIAMTCLRRTVALRTLLRRRGIEATLRIGVKKTGDALAGHAWLEIEGKVLADIPAIAESFRPLAHVCNVAREGGE